MNLPIFHSLRWRVQAWHGVILVLVLAAFGYGAYQMAGESQLRRVDQDLQQRLSSLFRPQMPGPGPGPDRERPPERPGLPPDEPGRNRGPGSEMQRRVKNAVEQAGVTDSTQTNSFYYLMWNREKLIASSPNAPAPVPAPESAQPLETEDRFGKGGGPRGGPMSPPTFRTRGEARECFRFLPEGECILVGHDMAPEVAAMERLAFWLAMAGGGVWLVGLAGGWWLSSRAIRPIEDISFAATKIAGGDLSQRINAADTDSEFGRLVTILNSTFARLEAAFANQARFTADASHELRTPVSVVLAQTQVALQRERPAAEYREALEACQRAAQRMRTLTESLLMLARLDAGQDVITRERLDLASVARECVELVRPLAEARGIQFQCLLQETQCMGDAGRLGQVATNLLTNAIHFNRERGKVSVIARAENGSAILTVADTGQGIPPEDLPHIFERFYRVDRSRSRVEGRNGLGLAIAKAVVDVHGGSIDVSSEPQKGSVFTVKLPVD